MPYQKLQKGMSYQILQKECHTKYYKKGMPYQKLQEGKPYHNLQKYAIPKTIQLILWRDNSLFQGPLTSTVLCISAVNLLSSTYAHLTL